jgi:outer membrane protein TolC
MTLGRNAALDKHDVSHIGQRTQLVLIVLGLLAGTSAGFAQATPNIPTPGAPLTITLQDALQRARQNDPQYHDSITQLGVAHEDRVQARAGLLPDVNFNSSFIYTQGTGPVPPDCKTSTLGCPASRFVANNGVHEYINQGNAHEALSLTNVADYRRADAALAMAQAKAEVATRGLVVTVTQLYYGLVVSERKYATAQRAATEAGRFLDISQKLENGGEVAHADVIKARIQAQQQQRLQPEFHGGRRSADAGVVAVVCRGRIGRAEE